MRRRPEAYHARLSAHERRARRAARRTARRARRASATIHDLVRSRERRPASRAAPLRRLRASIRASSTCFAPGTTPGAFAHGRRGRARRCVGGRLPVGRPAATTGRGWSACPRRRGQHAGRRAPVRVEKRFAVGGDRRSPDAGPRGPRREPRRRARSSAAAPSSGPLTMLGGGREPGRLLPRRRRAAPPRLAASRAALGELRSRQRLRRPRRRDARRAGGHDLVATDRDGLQLGGRLRARLPGQRARLRLAGRPCRRGADHRAHGAHGHHGPRPGRRGGAVAPG